MNNWKVHVEDFGKIRTADICVKPLTLFIGDNNSGKSYMMTLIYGLLSIRLYFDKYIYNDSMESYKQACAILDKMIEKDGAYVLLGDELKVFVSLLNEVIKKNKNKFIKELFNTNVKLKDISFDFMDNSYIFQCVRVQDENETDYISMYCLSSGGARMGGYRIKAQDKGTNLEYQFFLAYIMECMLKKDIRNDRSKDIVYFPTARTGYVLTYKMLVKTAMEDKFSTDETSRTLLTRPNSDFLTKLGSMSMQKTSSRYNDIINFVENDILMGKISVSELPSHDLMYTPKGNRAPISMHVSSGVVTEIAPLVLFLRYANPSALLIEEPEISLHPKFQKLIARVLIRLANKGMFIAATTHSDIILQHINNMIKLYDADANGLYTPEKIGYNGDDILDRNKIAVYQFKIDDRKKTVVYDVECGEYGFEANTFYDALKELNDEIRDIEGM